MITFSFLLHVASRLTDIILSSLSTAQQQGPPPIQQAPPQIQTVQSQPIQPGQRIPQRQPGQPGQSFPMNPTRRGQAVPVVAQPTVPGQNTQQGTILQQAESCVMDVITVSSNCFQSAGYQLQLVDAVISNGSITPLPPNANLLDLRRALCKYVNERVLHIHVFLFKMNVDLDISDFRLERDNLCVD